MGADETQEEQIARHLAGDVHDSDVASDADSSSDDDDDDASTSSVEVLSNANGAVPTATAVRFRRRNPKRPNTQSHARYEKYKSATTVQQFLDRGGTRADLRNDVDKGFAKLGKAARRDFDDDSEPEAPAPKKRRAPSRKPARRRRPKAPPPRREARRRFFLCQLRWQYGTIVAPGGGFAAFDEALGAADASQGPEDVASCGDLMNAFLRGPALGDRWVPWHTVTCEQERFLMTELRSAPDLDDREKFVLATAFSASRCDVESLCPAARRAARRAFRDRGNKLHTRAFNSYPQRGDGGANYCDYIIHRHAHFAEIGLAAYDLVAAPGGVSLAALDACYRGFDRIGPTMSKVLLVTNAWRPHSTSSATTAVGDGADEASFLYGAGGGDAARSGASATSSTTNSPALDAAEPRFRPHRLVAERTRWFGHPGAAIAGATIATSRSALRVAPVPRRTPTSAACRARRRAVPRRARGLVGVKECNLHGIISDEAVASHRRHLRRPRMSAWATIWKRPSFQRKFTLVVSGLTAFYCVLEADYTDAAGKEHCFTWVQAYYRKEVVAPAAAAKAWVKAQWS
ncbi:hypothetical protein JL720_5527 [Aureococcus anophagefferens]|nr:hypothetical protein JL720_5527 [Aureococcus anophagefferens]